MIQADFNVGREDITVHAKDLNVGDEAWTLSKPGSGVRILYEVSEILPSGNSSIIVAVIVVWKVKNSENFVTSHYAPDELVFVSRKK